MGSEPRPTLELGRGQREAEGRHPGPGVQRGPPPRAAPRNEDRRRPEVGRRAGQGRDGRAARLPPSRRRQPPLPRHGHHAPAVARWHMGQEGPELERQRHPGGLARALGGHRQRDPEGLRQEPEVRLHPPDRPSLAPGTWSHGTAPAPGKDQRDADGEAWRRLGYRIRATDQETPWNRSVASPSIPSLRPFD